MQNCTYSYDYKNIEAITSKMRSLLSELQQYQKRNVGCKDANGLAFCDVAVTELENMLDDMNTDNIPLLMKVDAVMSIPVKYINDMYVIINKLEGYCDDGL